MGVGVGVAVGVPVAVGVCVGVGEGVGMVTVNPSGGISSSCPGEIRVQSERALKTQMASAVVPYLAAILSNVSPCCTT